MDVFELSEEIAALDAIFGRTHRISQGSFSVPAGDEGDPRIMLTINRIDFLQGDVESTTPPMAITCMVRITQRKEDLPTDNNQGEPTFWRDHLPPVIEIFKNLEWTIIGGAELDLGEAVKDGEYDMTMTFQKTP